MRLEDLEDVSSEDAASTLLSFSLPDGLEDVDAKEAELALFPKSRVDWSTVPPETLATLGDRALRQYQEAGQPEYVQPKPVVTKSTALQNMGDPAQNYTLAERFIPALAANQFLRDNFDADPMAALQSSLARTPGMVARAVTDVAENVVNPPNLLTGYKAPRVPILKEAGDKAEAFFDEAATGFESDVSKPQGPFTERLQKNPVKTLSEGMASAAGTFIPVVGAAMLGGAPAAAMLGGALEYGDAYRSVKDLGGDDTEASVAATVYAPVAAALESIGAGATAKTILKGLRPGSRALNLAENMAKEGTTEGVQVWAQYVARRLADAPEESVYNVFEQSLEEFVAGGGVAGGMSTLGAGRGGTSRVPGAPPVPSSALSGGLTEASPAEPIVISGQPSPEVPMSPPEARAQEVAWQEADEPAEASPAYEEFVDALREPAPAPEEQDAMTAIVEKYAPDADERMATADEEGGEYIPQEKPARPAPPIIKHGLNMAEVPGLLSQADEVELFTKRDDLLNRYGLTGTGYAAEDLLSEIRAAGHEDMGEAERILTTIEGTKKAHRNAPGWVNIANGVSLPRIKTVLGRLAKGQPLSSGMQRDAEVIGNAIKGDELDGIAERFRVSHWNNPEAERWVEELNRLGAEGVPISEQYDMMMEEGTRILYEAEGMNRPFEVDDDVPFRKVGKAPGELFNKAPGEPVRPDMATRKGDVAPWGTEQGLFGEQPKSAPPVAPKPGQPSGGKAGELFDKGSELFGEPEERLRPSNLDDVDLKITAYHGTGAEPFYQFSDEKIGSGEGAQAYGYGHYFASNKEVSEWYAKKDSRTDAFYYKWDGRVFIHDVGRSGEVYEEESGAVDYRDPLSIAITAEHTGENLEQQLRSAENEGEDWRGQIEALREAIKIRGQIEPMRGVSVSRVTLAPEESDLLDWDKPLSGQSKKVKDALARVLRVTKPEQRALDDFDVESVGELEQLLHRAPNGAYLYGTLSDIYRTDREASRALSAAGIPGIRYLDGSSRGKGKGSHNYVIFDPADISIDEWTRFRQDDRKSSGLPRARVEELVADVAKSVGIEPVILQNDWAELRAKAGGARVTGFFQPGKWGGKPTIYLIAGNMKTEAEAVKTYLHEVVGHMGLKALLGEDLGKVLSNVYAQHKAAIDAHAKENGYTTGEGALDLSTVAGQQKATEEWIAAKAEDENASKLSGIKYLFFRLRLALRKVAPDLRWTDDDLRALLTSSRRRLERERGGSGEAAFRKTSDGPRDVVRAAYNLFNVPGFLEFAGVDNKRAAHEWLKERHGLDSLRNLKDEQLLETQNEFNRWRRERPEGWKPPESAKEDTGPALPFSKARVIFERDRALKGKNLPFSGKTTMIEPVGEVPTGRRAVQPRVAKPEPLPEAPPHQATPKQGPLTPPKYEARPASTQPPKYSLGRTVLNQYFRVIRGGRDAWTRIGWVPNGRKFTELVERAYQEWLSDSRTLGFDLSKAYKGLSRGARSWAQRSLLETYEAAFFNPARYAMAEDANEAQARALKAQRELARIPGVAKVAEEWLKASTKNVAMLKRSGVMVRNQDGTYSLIEGMDPRGYVPHVLTSQFREQMRDGRGPAFEAVFEPLRNAVNANYIGRLAAMLPKGERISDKTLRAMREFQRQNQDNILDKSGVFAWLKENEYRPSRQDILDYLRGYLDSRVKVQDTPIWRLVENDARINTKEYGNVEYHRNLDLPWRITDKHGKEWKILETDPVLLLKHLDKSARRAAVARNFGARTANATVAEMRDYLVAEGVSAKDADQVVVPIWNRLQGSDQGYQALFNHSETARKAYAVLDATAAAMQLSLATVSNLVGGHAPMTVRAGLGKTAKAFFWSFTHRLGGTEAEKYARLGAVLDNVVSAYAATEEMDEKARAVVSKWLGLTGFTWANAHINLAIAYHMATELGAMIEGVRETKPARWWNEVLAVGWTQRRAMDYLVNELRFTKADIARMVKDGVTKKDVMRSIQKSQENINAIHESPTERPAALNRPLFNIIFRYSSYVRKFADTVEYSTDEARKGNVMPLCRLLVAGPVTAEVMTFVRNWLHDREREEKNIWERLKNDLVEVGSFGLLGTLNYYWQVKDVHGNGLFETVFQPPVIESTIGLLEGVAQSGIKSVEQGRLTLTPIFTAIVRNAALLRAAKAQAEKTLAVTGTDAGKRLMAERLSKLVYHRNGHRKDGTPYRALEPRPPRAKTAESLLKRWYAQGYTDRDLQEAFRELNAQKGE